MIKLEKDRHPNALTLITSLRDHLKYLADTKHDDHEGMIMMPGRNYGCADDSAQAFIDGVNEADAKYEQVRDGLQGKRSPRLWQEIIYNLGVGVFHTEDERLQIERKIIAEFAPNSAARATWHVDPETGYDDLHILIAAKTKDGTMTLARTEENQLSKFKRIDRETADDLNARPSPKRTHTIKTAAQVGHEKARERAKAKKKPKPKSLPQQIAKMTKKEVTAENLPSFLKKLGIEIAKLTQKSIHLLFPRRRKKGTYWVKREGIFELRELLLQILGAQREIRIAKEKKSHDDIS